MEADCLVYMRRCHKCEVYVNFKNQLSSFISTLTSPWKFSLWGIDINGKITPKGTGGHEYMLIAVNYFTKWVEVASYASVALKHVAKFIINNIICRYGVPHKLISDQGITSRRKWLAC